MISTTDSLGRTVFWMTDSMAIKGDYGLFTFPPHPYITARGLEGQTFTKIVACVGGDRLERYGQEVFCNGRFLATIKTLDSAGQPLPDSQLPETIPEGMAFMLGTHASSGDSRYFGLVPLDKVKKVIPLW